MAPKKALAPHLVVKALAGTGKTTSMIEGVCRILQKEGMRVPGKRLTGSPEQEAIWTAMLEGKFPNRVAVVAYNRAIATELQNRVPPGVDACTMHSLGFAAVRQAFKGIKVESNRTKNLLEKYLGEMQFQKLRKENYVFIAQVEQLVSLCKQCNTDTEDNAEIDDLVAHYGVPVNGDREKLYDYVKAVLDLSLSPDKDKQIDFDDMVWLPVTLDLPVIPYDLLIVDESQDLNRSRQQLTLKFGRRIVVVGDENQAIYGFAGADAESMKRMECILSESERGCGVLPLSETRRCGKAIVAEAQKIVPEFRAHETCPEGSVGHVDQKEFLKQVGPKDMVLCRINADLVRQAFAWIKQRVPCYIRGRDIGNKLSSIVQKSKADSLPELFHYVENYREGARSKELAKKNPSDSTLQNIDDTCDCILLFADDVQERGSTQPVKDIIAAIAEMFSDQAKYNAIQLSSIHKSKGLEADNVWIIRPDLLPGPWAKLEWEMEQEHHLHYVAITRAIHNLRYVRPKNPISREAIEPESNAELNLRQRARSGKKIQAEKFDFERSFPDLAAKAKREKEEVPF